MIRLLKKNRKGRNKDSGHGHHNDGRNDHNNDGGALVGDGTTIDDFDRSFEYFQQDMSGGSGAAAAVQYSPGARDKEAWSKAAVVVSNPNQNQQQQYHPKKQQQQQQQQNPSLDHHDSPFEFGSGAVITNNSNNNNQNYNSSSPPSSIFDLDDDRNNPFKDRTAVVDAAFAFPDDPFALGGPSSVFPTTTTTTTNQQQPKSFSSSRTAILSSSTAAAVAKTVVTDATTHQHRNYDDAVDNDKKDKNDYDEDAVDTTVVSITVYEQLSALYDEVSKEPTCQVDGTVQVKYNHHQQQQSHSTTTTNNTNNKPFCITMRDLMHELSQLDTEEDVCQDISDKVSRRTLHRGDRVLKVKRDHLNLPSSLSPSTTSANTGTAGNTTADVTTAPEDIEKDLLQAQKDDNNLEDDNTRIIANYTCLPTLRPVPLLVKSRVQMSQRHCRAGFKIRANPSNKYVLKKMVIIVAVPPHVRGETVKILSKLGGTWDEMKRTITWSVDSLEAGEALEVQLQFDCIDNNNNSSEDGSSSEPNNDRAPKFPVLVRADCSSLFSSIEFKSDYSDGMNPPVNMDLVTTGRVLHRKV